MFKEATWMLLIPELCISLGAAVVMYSLLVRHESLKLYKRFPDYQAKNICLSIECFWLCANIIWMIADCSVDAPGQVPWHLTPLYRDDPYIYSIIRAISGAGCICGFALYLVGTAYWSSVYWWYPQHRDAVADNLRCMLLSSSTATWCLKDYLWSQGFVPAALVVDCTTALFIVIEGKVERGYLGPLTYAWLSWVASNALWLWIDLADDEFSYRLTAASLASISGGLVIFDFVKNNMVDDANTLTEALVQYQEASMGLRWNPESLPVAPPKARVAVIGAGPAGLSALWAFKDSVNVEIACFEKSGAIGGQWSFDPELETCEQPQTSMYKDLWSNGPKEAGSEYADYTYLEHFGKAIPSYPPRACIADYICGRARKYDLLKFVRLRTEVARVTWSDATRKFTVVTRGCETGEETSEQFDFVIVANGHFAVPHMPKFPGLESFRGEVLHSKDFADARRFRGKRILAVGGSLSAEDVALQCFKFGASKITITNRRAMGYAWPAPVTEVPLLVSVAGSTVTFEDGTHDDFDVIVLCTGYEYSFPFLSPELTTKADNKLVVKDLYKGVFFVDRPELMYLGMQNQVYTFIMFDLQASLARLAVAGNFAMPAASVMHDDITAWLAKQADLVEAKDWHALQTEYVKELNMLTSLAEEKDILCQKALDDSEDDKVKDILNFRNGCFSSSFSGACGTEPPVPWLKATEELPLGTYLQSLMHEGKSCPPPRMLLEEYAVLEQQILERWGIRLADSEAFGKYIAPSVRVPAGEIVMVLPPYNILTWDEAMQIDNDLVIKVRAGGKENALFSAARSRSSLDCYLNHSCDPNLAALVLADYSINMVALRDIQAGEVLAWDYMTTEEDLVAFEADFDCQCGAADCRKHIRGFANSKDTIEDTMVIDLAFMSSMTKGKGLHERDFAETTTQASSMH
jgi:trimethylamine monooxygenase